MVPVFHFFLKEIQEPKMGGFYPKKQPKTILSIEFPVFRAVERDHDRKCVLTSIVKKNI